jgi:hypothetical protein
MGWHGWLRAVESSDGGTSFVWPGRNQKQEGARSTLGEVSGAKAWSAGTGVEEETRADGAPRKKGKMIAQMAFAPPKGALYFPQQ